MDSGRELLIQGRGFAPVPCSNPAPFSFMVACLEPTSRAIVKYGNYGYHLIEGTSNYP